MNSIADNSIFDVSTALSDVIMEQILIWFLPPSGFPEFGNTVYVLIALWFFSF